MHSETKRSLFVGRLTLLIICAVLLTARLIYLYLADASQFPIKTVKIEATYEHVSREQLEKILSDYMQASFFTLQIKELQTRLDRMPWVSQAKVERVWPETIKITLLEKIPAAIWNNQLVTAGGEFLGNIKDSSKGTLPKLIGPENQLQDVLQNYKKLSKLLESSGLSAAVLQLRENQAWDLTLSNGITLRLGKWDIEARLKRFCSAYSTVFADVQEQLSSVDLRYARGMAVQRKKQTGR